MDNVDRGSLVQNFLFTLKEPQDMLQILQHQRTGRISVEELPPPALRPGGVLVGNIASVISPGTERASMETARASLLGKALRRPELVRETLDNIRREGLVSSARKVRTRLDSYKELGYSCAGVVLNSSTGKFKPGDAVACGGAEYAHHAEVVFVPQNLTARIPAGLPFEHAAFATLVAVGINGARQAGVQVGDRVLVIGLGLIGMLTAQVLRSAGCVVVAMDISDRNFEKAKLLGIEECFSDQAGVLEWCRGATGGNGFDCTVITAASRSSVPVELAVSSTRKKGTIVVVGDVEMKISRREFYRKELQVLASTSYGPGRYDQAYEQDSSDYPYSYVRWTAGRNIEAAVDMMVKGKVTVDSLVSHRFEIKDGGKAYEQLSSKEHPPLGVLLTYPNAGGLERRAEGVRSQSVIKLSGGPVIGMVGAGNFASTYILPFVKGANLRCIITQRPVSAKTAAEKFGFEKAGTDTEDLFRDPGINTLVVATRHDSHALYTSMGLEHGMNVFVEKPLALNREELKRVAEAYNGCPDRPYLLAGFNRRFSQSWRDIRDFFQPRTGPMSINYRISAGQLSDDHWIFLPGQGGRIVGEVCHFIDTIAFLTGALPVRVFASSQPGIAAEAADTTVSLQMSDGSTATISYITSGSPLLPKEYCEVFSGNRTVTFNNFRRIEYFRARRSSVRRYDGKKGHEETIAHFLNVVAGREQPLVSFKELYAVSSATLGIQDSLRTGQPHDVTD